MDGKMVTNLSLLPLLLILGLLESGLARNETSTAAFDVSDHDSRENHGGFSTTTSNRDENHPLVRVLETRPHSLKLVIKPWQFKPDTMIRLLYERVPVNKGPFMLHLDDPVIEYIPLIRREQSYTLTELPMGKYIVCGEALLMGEVYQTSCFETSIQRLDTNSNCPKY